MKGRKAEVKTKGTTLDVSSDIDDIEDDFTRALHELHFLRNVIYEFDSLHEDAKDGFSTIFSQVHDDLGDVYTRCERIFTDIKGKKEG